MYQREYRFLALDVNAACRLVEDIYGCIMQYRACERKSLTLSAGEVPGILTKRCIKSVFGAQKFRKPALFKDFPKPLVIGVQTDDKQVVTHRSFEEKAVVTDVCYVSYQAFFVYAVDAFAVDRNGSTRDTVSPHEQRCDCRFAAAALSDDADKAVFRNDHIYPVQYLTAVIVGKANAGKSYLVNAVYRLRFF